MKMEDKDLIDKLYRMMNARRSYDSARIAHITGSPDNVTIARMENEKCEEES